MIYTLLDALRRQQMEHYEEHEVYELDHRNPKIQDSEVVLINLNQPRFVAELLQYLLEVRIKPEETGIVTFSDGKEILRGLGYMFQYFLTEV